jgi:hypothetical protein
MTDAEFTARLDRIDARLDRLVAAMEARDEYLEKLDAQVGRLVTAEGRHTELLVRGFSWRDKQVAELLSRVGALEERLPPAGEV